MTGGDPCQGRFVHPEEEQNAADGSEDVDAIKLGFKKFII